MSKRNRVLVIPFTKNTEKDLKATLIREQSYGWWDDSVYNTAKKGDTVIVVDNKTQDVLYEGTLISRMTSEAALNAIIGMWESHDPMKDVWMVHKNENQTKTKLKDYVTKTGRVQGTTLRYGI